MYHNQDNDQLVLGGFIRILTADYGQWGKGQEMIDTEYARVIGDTLGY